MTNLIDRSLSADALSVSENKKQSFPTFPTLVVGNAEMDSAGLVLGNADWILDDLLSADVPEHDPDSTTAYRKV